MPRPIREDFAGAWHHVMNRGRNRERIFLDDEDALSFLFVVQCAIERYGIEIHGYSLMPNHYHLLVYSPLGNISDAMKHIGETYTQAFNARHGKDGPLFRGRFKSQLVKHEAYLTYLLAYLHLNPLRAGLITRLDGLGAWTGHRRYMGKDSEPQWLSVDAMLARFGSPAEMKELMLRLHRKSEPWPEGLRLDTGWFAWHLCPADPERPPKVPDDAVEVQVLLDDICQITGAPRDRLKQSIRGRGGNPERRFAAWALHRTTRMTHREIGRLLKMSAVHVAKDIERTTANPGILEAWFKQWRAKYPQKLSYVKA
jgi:REP element-mobilizing transposase RayT